MVDNEAATDYIVGIIGFTVISILSALFYSWPVMLMLGALGYEVPYWAAVAALLTAMTITFAVGALRRGYTQST